MLEQLKNHLPYGFKKSISEKIWWFGYPLARFRCEPDFIIVGAQKAGTTSLYATLLKSRNIALSYKKELHYFDQNFDRSLSWYKAHFPLNLGRQGKIIGEATPSYIVCPQTAQRMAATYPDIKLVMMIRDPVDRAISHYYKQLRRGTESRDIHAALFGSHDRILQIENELLSGNMENEQEFYLTSYLERGRYLKQIKRFREYYSADQLHIIEFSNYTEHFSKEITRLETFLGVSLGECKESVRRNTGRNKSQVDDSVIKDLSLFYSKENRDLFDFLGQDYVWK